MRNVDQIMDGVSPTKAPSPIKFAGYSLIGVLGVVLFLGTYFTVDQNEEAVVTNFGEFSYVADPGLHFKMPFMQSVTHYRTDIQSLEPSQRVNTYTIDNQEVDVLFTVFYRVPPDKISFIYSSNRDFKERLYSLTVDRLKAAMGQVNVQSVAEKRGELRDAIKVTLTKDAAPLGIAITDFQLTDLQYTDAFRQAVNNAAVQKANVESFEYQRQQAEKQAQTAAVAAEGTANAVRAKARGDADARLLQATAEAKAIQLQGEAQAAAIKAQADALKANPDLVNLRKAERWNGELPKTMLSNVMPLMNVGQ